jgi:hypothetical protein
MSAGLALTTSPATEAIMGALPPAKAGAGSAVNDTTREVGGTLGVAIIGSVLNSAYGSHVMTGLTGLGAPAAVARTAGQSVVAGLVTAAHFPHALQAAAAESVRQAFMTGLHQGSFAAAGATAAAAIVALAFLPHRARTEHAPAAPGRGMRGSAAVHVAAERGGIGLLPRQLDLGGGIAAEPEGVAVGEPHGGARQYPVAVDERAVRGVLVPDRGVARVVDGDRRVPPRDVLQPGEGRGDQGLRRVTAEQQGGSGRDVDVARREREP